jgi:hypothetical protein
MVAPPLLVGAVNGIVIVPELPLVTTETVPIVGAPGTVPNDLDITVIPENPPVIEDIRVIG